MPLFQIFANAYVANSCKHNSYGFSDDLEPIVTHEELFCLKAVSFIRPFLSRGMHLFQIFADVYIANSGV